MFYKFLTSYSDQFSSFNIFRYITFRSFLAFFTSFFICWFFAPFFIKNLKKKKVRQPIRKDGPEFHLKKSGTPTMGGGIILISLFFTSFLWMNLSNPLVLSTLILTLGFASIGFIDDKLKLKTKSSKGLSGDFKLALECLLTITLVSVLIYLDWLKPTLTLPFLKDVVINLSWFYPFFACLVVVGAANSVNLTDGLDGLAIFPLIVSVGTFIVFSYVAGHFKIAKYLGIPFISGAGELAPLAACVVAAGLAFLWYNTYPAQVFMGDVGSLSLGGFLGMLAVLTKNEFLLVLIGGIFVIEALSVIVQVFSFKLTGKRIFQMAPIHHHFEMKGLSETKIIVRFWIVSILLATLALSTLKLR